MERRGGRRRRVSAVSLATREEESAYSHARECLGEVRGFVVRAQDGKSRSESVRGRSHTLARLFTLRLRQTIHKDTGNYDKQGAH
jgi:hypothetical protein